jgi:hypothetical protein
MPGLKSHRDLQLVDTVLTNLARAYKPKGFIYNEVTASMTVTEDAGRYPIFEGFFDDDVESKVADRAETPEVDTAYSTDTYYCEDYRLKASITAKERRQAHGALHLEQAKLDTVLIRMAIRRERRIAALLRKTTNGGGLNLGGGVSNKWNTDAATIELDISAAKSAVYNATGQVPDTLIMPYAVAAAVAVQQDIREIIKYTVNGNDVLSQGEFILPRTLWGLNVVIPQGALRNSAKEGGTRSLSDVWSDNVVLLKRGTNEAWGSPATAYSFRAMPEIVDRWKENDPPVEYVRAWECVDEKIVAPDLGYEITDVL